MQVIDVVGILCASILFGGDTVSAQEWEFLEGHAVKKNGTGKGRLPFNDTDAQNTEEFVDICRSMCESGEADGENGACGGFVVNYTDKRKVKPKFCVFKKESSQPLVKTIKDTYLITGYGAVESAEEDEDDYDDEDIATLEFLTIDPDSDYFYMDSDDIAQESLQRPHDDRYDSLSEEELRENYSARERETAVCLDSQSPECRKIQAHRAILTHLYGGPECIEGWKVRSSITHPEFFGYDNCDDEHAYGKVIHGATYALYPIVSQGNGPEGNPCSLGDQPSSDHFSQVLHIPGYGYSSSLPIPYKRGCIEEFYKNAHNQSYYPWSKDDYQNPRNCIFIDGNTPSMDLKSRAITVPMIRVIPMLTLVEICLLSSFQTRPLPGDGNDA